MRPLSQRALNRTLLERQLLARRGKLPVVRAVDRLVAMQAQYAPSPYVALWSRLDGFRKEQLTRAFVQGTVLKAGVMRGTLHVVTRDLFPSIVAAHIESQSGRIKGLGTDPRALAAAFPDRPVNAGESSAIAQRALGTDDRWTIAFTLRAMPWLRTAPLGPWPHMKPPPEILWRDPLPDAQAGATRVVRDYLRAYGPATREDVEQFTSFKLRQIDPALEGMRTLEDDLGRTLFDLPRGRIAAEDAPGPVRFLPPYDSIILAHRDRSRILPHAYFETVIRRKNATTLATFTVDGLIAGSWKVETVRGRTKLQLDPFAPLPRKARAEVDAEGERLVAFHDSES